VIITRWVSNNNLKAFKEREINLRQLINRSKRTREDITLGYVFVGNAFKVTIEIKET
jgi:hypothetical protein